MEFKHLIWNLTRTDIDLVNVVINIVESYDEFDIGHTFDYNSPIYMLDMTYHDLASSLGYLTLNFKIIQEINIMMDSLSRTQATIFYNGDHDRCVENTTFILKYTLSSVVHGNERDLNKRFTLMLSTSLVKVLRENKDLFSKLYVHDKYDLRGKYSTILYDEISRRANGSNTVATIFTIDELAHIIDFDIDTTTNFDSWTKINGNILKRSVKEIINKSNMYLEYDKVKEKVEDVNRTQTVGVRFETSLAPESEETPSYFESEFLMERKIAYYAEKEINRKVNELRKFNDDRVKDEDGYRHSERVRQKKLKPEFESKVKIQDLVNWIKYNYHGEDGLVCFFDFQNCDYVTVNSEHKLLNVKTQKILNKSATDTFKKIQEFLNQDGEYGLLDIDNKREYSISYTKG